MKLLMIVFLALAGCAQKANEINETAPFAQEPEPAIRERIVPGTTYGNVALQAETVAALKNATADLEHADCSPEQMHVADTWAPHEPATSAFSSAFLRWRELWILDVCGRDLDFEIVYMRHETGIMHLSVSQQREGQAFVLD